MRTFSSNMIRALLSQYTNEVILFLVAACHADWPIPIRLVNDRVAIVSNGETYNPYPFEVLLPAEDTSQPQAATQIVFCNVDRQMIALLRALQTMPTIELSIILASTPDTIEFGPAVFLLTGYDYNLKTVTCVLSYEDTLKEIIPADTFNPVDYPGLH